MTKFRRVFAVFLLLIILCGCAAPREMTTVFLPGSERGFTPDAPSAAAAPDAAQTGSTTDFHFEYDTVPPPVPLLSVTALTVLDEAMILGGFTEHGLSLSRMTLDGENTPLPLPGGAAYLYALTPEENGGFWLLSGSLPAAYADGLGVVHFSEGESEGKLVLTRYNAAFSMQESILLQTAYTDGPRFFQLQAAKDGFFLLSASVLLLLDKDGAELARQSAEMDGGWSYQAMALSGGALCVLTRCSDLYGEQTLPELRRFDPETLTALEALSCAADVTGLGLNTDGRLLCGSQEGIELCPQNLAASETILSWRELGVCDTAEQLLPAADALILYSPGETALSLLRRVPGPPPEKTILTLAIVSSDPIFYDSLTAMIEGFNRSQDRYLVEATIYSDFADDSFVPVDRLRTQIAAGQAPDLYAFYTAGYNAPPLAAKTVGADLLPLIGSDLTQDSLVPNLYALLTEDGCLYELPLTVEVDTLIGPASLFPEAGVTLLDLEHARQNMADDMLPFDSWNTPENLFSLCAAYCIGAFTDKAAGTCNFDTQSFYDYLTWCKTWGGDGSTPSAPERTLVKLSMTNTLGQLAVRSESAKEIWFGEPDYTYIGFPTNGEGSGSAYRILSSLAVSPQCRDLTGAKAFLAYGFSYPQDVSLPANYELLQTEMDEYIAGNRTNWRGETQKISEADAGQFYTLLDSITVLEGPDAPLAEILFEEANVFFAGGCTAEEAARNIQSRASLYLQEQYP